MFIIALAFALLVSAFAVINVDNVTVDYFFGTSRLPLIVVILSSALMGGIIVGCLGLLKVFSLRRDIRKLKRDRDEKEVQLELAERSMDTAAPNVEGSDQTL
nr:lipopolysaccharide assembly protein LapA domain-containing protein [Peribacillus deserti]